MNEETTCFICFEDNIDTVLTCCDKKIHGSCVKQWWRSNNISIDDAICPHCRQRCILDKYRGPEVLNQNNIPEIPLPNSPISPVVPSVPAVSLTSTFTMYTNPVSNNYVIQSELNNHRRNRIFTEQEPIVHNNIYSLTDNEIQLINSNRNNAIPNNAFSHQMINNNNPTNDFISCSRLLLCLIIMIGTIIALILVL